MAAGAVTAYVGQAVFDSARRKSNESFLNSLEELNREMPPLQKDIETQKKAILTAPLSKLTSSPDFLELYNSNSAVQKAFSEAATKEKLATLLTNNSPTPQYCPKI